MVMAQHQVIRVLQVPQATQAMLVLQVVQEIREELHRLTGLEKQDHLGMLATQELTQTIQTKTQEY